MSRLQLTASQRRRLEHVLRTARGAGLFRRVLAILEVDSGRSIAETARLLRTSRVTIYHWIGCFQRTREPTSLVDHRGGNRPSVWDEELQNVLRPVSGDTKTDPPGDTKTDPLLDTCQGGNMDNVDPDLVNLLDAQADQSDVTNVHMRSTQEDTRMLEPDVVDRIRELSGQGLGSKRIARQLGISRNSVRRYLAGATVGFQERLAARHSTAPRSVKSTNSSVPLPRETPSSFSRNWPPEGSRSICGPCNGPWLPCVRRNGPGRWPLSGSRPRRANSSRSTSVKRSSRSPVSPSRFI